MIEWNSYDLPNSNFCEVSQNSEYCWDKLADNKTLYLSFRLYMSYGMDLNRINYVDFMRYFK